jgi:hypothetical protein
MGWRLSEREVCWERSLGLDRKRIDVTNIDGVGFENTNRGNREW